MQPRFFDLAAQAFEFAWQIVRFRARHDGVPHDISASGKALQTVLDAIHHAVVVVLDFVARVNQHAGAA